MEAVKTADFVKTGRVSRCDFYPCFTRVKIEEGTGKGEGEGRSGALFQNSLFELPGFLFNLPRPWATEVVLAEEGNGEKNIKENIEHSENGIKCHPGAKWGVLY